MRHRWIRLPAAAVALALAIGSAACESGDSAGPSANGGGPSRSSLKAAPSPSAPPLQEAYAGAPPSPFSPPVAPEGMKLVEGNQEGLRYILTLPSGYYENASARWPLVVLLNGSDAAYADLKDRWLVEAAAKQQLPMLTLSPYKEKGWRYPGDEAMQLIDSVVGTLRVDPSRVYLTGFGEGGEGTWRLAGAYPDRFAAIAPIAADKVAAKTIRALAQMPIRAFHNAGDETARLADHQAAVDAAAKSGDDDATLTSYPQTGHDAWTRAYADPDLYAWMLKHSSIKSVP